MSVLTKCLTLRNMISSLKNNVKCGSNSQNEHSAWPSTTAIRPVSRTCWTVARFSLVSSVCWSCWRPRPWKIAVQLPPATWARPPWRYGSILSSSAPAHGTRPIRGSCWTALTKDGYIRVYPQRAFCIPLVGLSWLHFGRTQSRWLFERGYSPSRPIEYHAYTCIRESVYHIFKRGKLTDRSIIPNNCLRTSCALLIPLAWMKFS